MESDQHLLIALAEGNSKEIQNIYKKNFQNVKRFIFQNNGQLVDAEDIFQMALLQLGVRYREEPFEINSSFDAYLFTVCKNLWRRELNKHKSRVTTLDFIEPEDKEAQDNALALLEEKRVELFKDCLDKISDNCKTILSLYFAKEPYSNIVEKMGYSSETVVRQRVFKCKKKLTEVIKEDRRFQNLKTL